MGVCINRYVGQHEKIQPMEEESDQDKKPFETNTRKSQPATSFQVSMTDNAPLVHISDASVSPSNYDKLCLSLLSGLPNEQELALNVCTILSNEGSYMLQLEQAPKLVDLLVAQTGVWRLDDDSLKMLYLQSWDGLKGRNMHQFWRSTLDVKNEKLLQLLGLDLGEYEEEEDFFNLANDLGSLNIEGQRVLRIALILHNLSFEKNNVPVLVASKSFLRFILLSINSSWANLKQAAYDTLGNIAYTIKLSIEKDVCSRLMFKSVTDGVLSSDRFMAIRSMDILSQLCSCDPNEDVIPSLLDIEIYQQIVSYLTARDIMLLFYTLEALYALSDIGRYPCDRIACVHGSIASLVSLLTLDPSQYGPSAQIRMKIVETLVPAEPSGEQENKAEPAPSETPVSTPSSTPTVNVDSETFASNWLKSTYEVSPGSLTARNDVYADYVSFCSKAGRKGVLNANVFASCVKNSFPQCGLKKVTSSGVVVTFHHDGLKRKNVITSLGIPPVSKVITSTPVQKISTSTPTTTVSIKLSTPPKPVQSPILKAQLSANASATPLLKNYSQTVAKVVTPPTTRAAPNPAASSTLIKSLLANKVQQRNLQQNVSKMVIYSPGKMTGLPTGIVGSPTTIVRCIRPSGLPQVNINHQVRPSLQARIVPNKACLISTPNSGVIKANPMWSPKTQSSTVKSSIVTTSSAPIQFNGIQNEIKMEVCQDDEDSKNLGIITTSQLKQTSSILLDNQLLCDSGIDTKDSLLCDETIIHSPKNIVAHSISDQNILLTPVHDNTLTYKLASSSEVSTSSGNFFIVRSQPSTTVISPAKDQGTQRELVLMNGNSVGNNFSATAQTVMQPRIISSSNILKSVLNEFDSSPIGLTRHQQIQRESICKKAPLLNGLLDKCKLPLLEEFQSKILLQNGSSSKPDSEVMMNKTSTAIQCNQGTLHVNQGIMPTSSANSLVSMALNSVNPTSPANSITFSSNSISQGIFTVASASSVTSLSMNSITPSALSSPILSSNAAAPMSLNSIVIPSSSLNSVIIPASSLASAILPSSSLNSTTTNVSLSSTANSTAPVIVPSVLPATSFHSNGTDLMQICTGQTTFSGTVEMQPDQKGVVRLHIESPENSNQGSDLSSISDIARTLECASQAISRTNAECNTQVPYSSACVAPQTVTVINTNTPTIARTGQQIIVVTPVLNQPQLQLQSPNIKLCILQSFPKTDDSVDLITIPQLNLNQLRQPAPEAPIISATTLKRPSSDTFCIATNLKKPRVDSKSPLLEASLRLPSTAGIVVPSTAGITISSTSGIGISSTAGIGVSSAGIRVSSTAGIAVPSTSGIVVTSAGIAVPSMAGITVPSMAGITVPSMAGIAIPSMAGIAVPSMAGIAVPSMAGIAVPSMTGIAVQSIAGTTIPSTTSIAIPSTTNITVSTPISIAASATTNAAIDAKPLESLPIFKKSSQLEISPSIPKLTTPVQSMDILSDKEGKTFSGLTSVSDNPSLVTTTQTTTKTTKLEFFCEWKNCSLKFPKPGLVFLHASKVHVPLCNDDMVCQWEGCDSMKRKRFSLLTHLQDWHCTERVLHTQALRKLQLSQQGKTSIPPPLKPPPHPGYAPDAAVLAIKRHALQYINPKELSEEKESALTKSIRLTSALILRNLVTHSSVARTYVRRFEPELAYLAMSPVESARTIAQCLSELSRTHD